MHALRARIERMKDSSNPMVRVSFRGIKALGALRRFLLSSRIRSQVLTRLKNKERHFQGEAISFDDRYPELFAECRRRLIDLPKPRLLSFGCATGEEVFTLARYLPQARIVGVDINSWCLKECSRKNTSEAIRFVQRMAPEFVGLGEFDAIFCMAVFQRTEHRTEGARPTDTGFLFEHFEAELTVLDGMLKSGGILFLDECDFSFEQTAMAARYQPAEFEWNRVLRTRPLFDRDNRLMAEQHWSVRCYVKQFVAASRR